MPRELLTASVNLLALDPDRTGAYTVWLTMDGKWHASGHWYAFLTREHVRQDAEKMARRLDVVGSFAVRATSYYWAIKIAKAMFDAISLPEGGSA